MLFKQTIFYTVETNQLVFTYETIISTVKENTFYCIYFSYVFISKNICERILISNTQCKMPFFKLNMCSVLQEISIPGN